MSSVREGVRPILSRESSIESERITKRCFDIKTSDSDLKSVIIKPIIKSVQMKPESKINKESSLEKRTLRYDSADSSDSGVGGESHVWSPCSSVVSYSPPPILSDLEDDGIPPSPPQSSPSSPDASPTNLMAPIDATLVHKDPSKQRMMGLSPSESRQVHHLQDGHKVHHLQDGHKDRPPDRTRRNLTSTSPRKRGGDGVEIDRRSKACRPFVVSDEPFEQDFRVTTQPELLARLSGLTGTTETPIKPKFNRCSPRSKSDQLPKGPRLNCVRRSTTDQQDKLKEHLLNNNLSSRSNNNLSSNERLSLLPPLTDSCSSSGVGSSLNDEGGSTSGTSTPTQLKPKVRFPAPEKKDSCDTCRWRGCNVVLDQSSSLLEHIQAIHVEGQLEAESFRCLWQGCKVFDKASCSVSWLERHVLTHGGQKPFKCIVEGCGSRFRSQTALGRHVNHHFSSPSTVPAPRYQNHTSPTKLIRKNGRKLRYRKKPWSDNQTKPNVSRIFDFFDLSTMEKVRWGLFCSSQVQVESVPTDHVSFSAQVLCKRENSNGQSEVLVRWFPYDIIPDEWVRSDSLEPTRSVAFHELSYDGQIKASSFISPQKPTKVRRRKRESIKRRHSLTGSESPLEAYPTGTEPPQDYLTVTDSPQGNLTGGALLNGVK